MRGKFVLDTSYYPMSTKQKLQLQYVRQQQFTGVKLHKLLRTSYYCS